MSKNPFINLVESVEEFNLLLSKKAWYEKQDEETRAKFDRLYFLLDPEGWEKISGIYMVPIPKKEPRKKIRSWRLKK